MPRCSPGACRSAPCSGGPLGVFGHLLHLCGLGERTPGIMVTAHGALAPELLDLGRHLERDGRVTTLAAGSATVGLAEAELSDDLPAMAFPGEPRDGRPCRLTTR